MLYEGITTFGDFEKNVCKLSDRLWIFMTRINVHCRSIEHQVKKNLDLSPSMSLMNISDLPLHSHTAAIHLPTLVSLRMAWR
jgi:hypothetical protein